jgi:uncharacterized protein (TIGR00251 family)
VASVEHARHTAAPTRLRVRVAPGARRSAVVGRHGDAWKLRVHAAPERGRANAAVVDLLADVLGLAPRDVRVVAGHAARDKVVELDRLSLAEAERRLSSTQGDK